MRTLIWKEWREQRLFFFLAVGLIILSRIVPKLIPERITDYKLYALTMSYLILPIVFSLLLGALSFTNEFTRNTKSFLLSQPITSARLFWVKYFSGLFLIFVLIFLSYLVFDIPFSNLAPYDRGAFFYIFLLMIILYSATCFSSLLLKNTLPAIICTPFLLLFGFLLISPFIVILFLISSYWITFNFLTFSSITATFLVFSFLTWQNAIIRDISIIKTVLITAGAIFILSFASHTVANLAVSHKLNKTIKQAKAEGIKLTPEEVIPPLVPDKDNAAPFYQEAFDLADRLKEKYKTEWEYMPYESKIKIEELTETQKINIGRIMQDPEFAKLYALIEKAINMPACRFDIQYKEGPAMLLPHLAKMRSLARLSAARTYVLTGEKQYQEALHSAEAELQLGNFLADEPILISQLVRIAINSIAVESLNLFINSHEVALSDRDYHKLISILEEKNRNVIKSFEGELVLLGGYAFRHPFSLLSEYIPREFGKIYGSYLSRPVLKSDYAFYIRALSDTTVYSQKPYFAIRDRANKWDKKIAHGRFKYIISARLLPALSRILQQQANNNANLDSCKLALALKIYREKHGNYPDSLTSLAPEIIPEIPVDPFTGKDYIYRREDKGFMVYSFGPDEKDNKGIYDSKKRQDDISFKVKN